MAKTSFLSSHKCLDNDTNRRKQNMIESSIICSKKQRLNRLQGSSYGGAEVKYFLSKETSPYPVRFNGACDTGLYGLKLDSTETYVDEPTLDALIDGSFNFPVAHKSKGKQASDGSSTITRMVNQAFSVLRNADKIQSEKSNEQDSDSGEVLGARWCLDNYPSYSVKEVLEHLVTPSSKDVDSILLELRNPRGEIMSSYDTYINYTKEDLHKLYLPPFPWSLSQRGSNKSSTDNMRFLNTDNCWQRWVVQRSSTSLHCNNSGTSFQGLDFLPRPIPSHIEKIDGRVYDGAPLSMSIRCETHQANISCNHTGNKVITPMESDMNVDLPFQKGHTVRKIPLSLGNDFRKVESSFRIDQSKRLNNHPRNGGCFSSTKCTGENSYQQKCKPSLLVRSLDVSMLVAAEILCEMQGCSSKAETKERVY